MITQHQIRAARAYLEWDRATLSEESGISEAQIYAFESGTTKNPRQGTIEALERAFLQHGVGFKDGGIIPSLDSTIRFEGEGWYQHLLEDVYKTLARTKNPELLLFYTDDRKSPLEVNNQYRKIRAAGGRMRQLVEEGNTYLMGPLNEYRYVPRNRFNNYVSMIYGNKFALCTDNNTKAVVHNDKHLAEMWRNVFETLWDTMKQAKKSDANEQF
jgi:transcriptional regulator with XRE-family HTH domain